MLGRGEAKGKQDVSIVIAAQGHAAADGFPPQPAGEYGRTLDLKQFGGVGGLPRSRHRPDSACRAAQSKSQSQAGWAATLWETAVAGDQFGVIAV